MTVSVARTPRPLISIAIPVLDEAGSIPTLHTRLARLADTMADRCDLEFVFSDNASTDATWDLLTALGARDDRVRAIRFSKNVGFQRSILANYIHTRGDAVMQIDADMQDPPEMLETFFAKWREGFDVVYGVRRKRQEGAAITAIRRVGYWIIEKASGHPIPRDVGDFRLVDRRIVATLARMKTATPYLRGMIAEMGFRQTGVPYDRDARTAGASKFRLRQLVSLGLTALFNHSTLPLRIASFLGAVILAGSVLASLYYVGLRIFVPDLPRGLASIHILVLFGIGLNAFLLGVIGEYLLQIYLILRAEPVAIVAQSLNIDASDLKL